MFGQEPPGRAGPRVWRCLTIYTTDVTKNPPLDTQDPKDIDLNRGDISSTRCNCMI
jgi:hypothetical protein